MAKKKYVCTGCYKCTEPCTVELSGDEAEVRDPGKMMRCGTWVEVPAEEDTNKEQLPKLTVEVFSMEECPTWAQYAAVDSDGAAYWYAAKPDLTRGYGGWVDGQNSKQIDLCYDAADWKSSLIERPAEQQLPKLTAEVFSMAECPEWARYAAVDANGLAYWYNSEPELNTCTWCNTGVYFMQIMRGNERLRYDASDWKNSCIEHTKAKQLPKLTTDVFSMPECPTWARYAAVDFDGEAYWYDVKPELNICTWGGASTHFARQIVHKNTIVRYDASDWKNSLIERQVEEQLHKLTAEIFNHPECPADAVVAVVNDNGTAAWGNRVDIFSNSLGGFTSAHGDAKWTTIPGGACFDATDWKHSAVYRTGMQPKPTEQKAPKLTADVFSCSTANEWKYAHVNGRIYTGCPEWARYAAVDDNGTVYVYEKQPMRLYTVWADNGGHYAMVCDADKQKLKFDATDWKNSLIERPVKKQLPKLTVEVFSLPECPDWAKYAAVDEDGVAWYYGHKPRAGFGLWDTPALNVHAIYDHGRYARFDATDWEHSLIERPAPRPKLTAEVFSLSECPEWARYAAVDADGQAYWYDDVPCRNTDGLRWDNCGRHARKICYAGEVATPLFDASDWKNSLIERPAVAPDWFKPGVLAYNSDIHSFFHVTAGTEYLENYLEAKVRPFNDDELERKLGQTVLGPNNSRLLVIGFHPDGVISGKPEICVLGGLWLNAEELLNYGSRPQGIQQYRSKEGTWIDRGLSS